MLTSWWEPHWVPGPVPPRPWWEAQKQLSGHPLARVLTTVVGCHDCRPFSAGTAISRPLHCVVPEFPKPRQAAQWTRPCLQFPRSWPLFRNFTSQSLGTFLLCQSSMSAVPRAAAGCCSLGATTKQKLVKPLVLREPRPRHKRLFRAGNISELVWICLRTSLMTRYLGLNLWLPITTWKKQYFSLFKYVVGLWIVCSNLGEYSFLFCFP